MAVVVSASCARAHGNVDVNFFKIPTETSSIAHRRWAKNFFSICARSQDQYAPRSRDAHLLCFCVAFLARTLVPVTN